MLWFAPALLTRPDVALILAYVFVYLLLAAPRRRWRTVLGFVITSVVVLAHLWWRHQYYGEWWPNTYYLKLTRWPLFERLGAGIDQTAWTAGTLGLPFIIALFSLISLKRWHLLLLGPFVLSVAYQVYIGGDGRPLNRFVIPASTGLFVLTAQGIHRALMLFVNRKTQITGAAVRTILLLLSIAAMNGIHWNHCLLIARPQTTGDHRRNIQLWRAVEKVADPQASVAVAWAGTVPYFSQRRCFDLLGRNDPHIAHLPALPGYNRAGHNKFDLGYTLSHHRPDILLNAIMSYEPVLQRDYRPIAVQVDGTEVAFFVRRDSAWIHGGRTIGFHDAGRIIYRPRAF